MRKKEVAVLSAVIFVLLAALLATALSDRIFYATQYTTKGELVEDKDAGRYELPFYLYKDAWDKLQANVVDLSIQTEGPGPNLAKLSLTLDPKPRYQLDSWRLEFYIQGINQALILTDPQTGEAKAFEYTRTDGEDFVYIDIPRTGTATGQEMVFDLWLDLAYIPGHIDSGLILTDFYMHENSVFKIYRQAAVQQVLNIGIPVSGS